MSRGRYALLLGHVKLLVRWPAMVAVALLAIILLAGGEIYSLVLNRNESVQLGAAVAAEPLHRDPQYRETLRREFTSVTPENAMKWDALQPERGVYDFQDADAIVGFAAANGLEVRGHTLVWHRALPSWLEEGQFDREELITILRDHVMTVVGRYRGRVTNWDVVNEAIADDGLLRDTLWLRGIGPEYIAMAFRWAHEADPQARLYYNDYGGEGLGPKSDAIYGLVQDLIAEKVPIHGVGLQMHVSLGYFPEPQQVAENMARLGDLGVRAQITEMDLRIHDGTGSLDERLDAQAHVYGAMASVCQRSTACTELTTWGVSDRYTWVQEQRPSLAAPLLFDAAYRPKPAYDAVRAVLD